MELAAPVRMTRLLVLPAVVLAVLLGTAAAGDPPAADDTAGALAAALGALQQAGPSAAGPFDGRLAAIESSPELSRELMDLAAAIMTALVARYDGDPERMAAALERGRSDPEAFAATLDAATQARLEALSRKVERPGR